MLIHCIRCQAGNVLSFSILSKPVICCQPNSFSELKLSAQKYENSLKKIGKMITQRIGLNMEICSNRLLQGLKHSSPVAGELGQ